MHSCFVKITAIVIVAWSTLWILQAEPNAVPESVYFESSVYEAQLENGLAVYVIEDFSDALVRIEYTVRAGYADQTEKTAGYIPLYVQLFGEAGTAAQNYAPYLTAECTDTAARYVISVTPEYVQPVLAYIAECTLNPIFSNDSVLRTAAQFSNELYAFEQSPAGFINRVISSFIFTDASYQHATGIPSTVFKGKTADQIRVVLHDITRTLYVPSNSALFISGAIDNQAAVQFADAAFAQYDFFSGNTPRNSRMAADRQTVIRRTAGINKKAVTPKSDSVTVTAKRFVLVDSDFSKDIHQTVLQFITDSSVKNPEIRALRNSFIQENSDFKKLLTSDEKMGIKSPDYVSCSVAGTNGIDRLVVQLITEPIQSPAHQAVTAEQYVLTAEKQLRSNQEQFATAIRFIQTENKAEQIDAASYMSARALHYSMAEIQDSVQTGIQEKIFCLAEPFTFVLAHPDTYKTYKNSFSKYGFQTIYKSDVPYLISDTKNTSVPDTKNLLDPEKSDIQISKSLSPAVRFADTLTTQLTEQILSNGIPLITKQTPLSSGISFILEIIGGERSIPQNVVGLESILIQAVAKNIAETADAAFAQGKIVQIPTVTAKTGTDSSYIQIECSTADFDQCVKAAADALIFADIKPAAADELVYIQQYTNRLQSADLAFQMYKAAMQLIYSGTAYEPLFAPDIGFFEHLSYDKIAAAYPSLLNANRYRLIAAGGTLFGSETIATVFEKYFGVFVPFPLYDENGNSGGQKKFPEIPPHFPQIETYLQLRRTFTAEAGTGRQQERPPVLIPTTEFNDPVQYYSPAPQTDPEQVLFNALLYELERRITEDIANSCIPAESVKIHAATNMYPFGAIQFTGIPRTFDTDAALYTTVDRLYNELAVPEVVATIRNNWVHKELAKTGTNAGTVQLIADSLFNTGTPARYAQSYITVENATQQDFRQIMTDWMRYPPPVRFYSASRRW